MFEVRRIQGDELDAYTEHLHRHVSESGIQNIIYAPFSRNYQHPLEPMRTSHRDAYLKKLDELRWRRMFGCFENGKIKGHIDLQSYPLDSSLHRCKLGMGIDREVRNRGVGKALMEAAIDWVKNDTPLEYVDLYVFSHNLPARGLYKKFGFVEVGIMQDMFRVDGEKIDDIQMVLKIQR